jgi:hypothetical protein
LPEITQSPTNRVVGEGESVTLTVVSPTPGVTYQWFYNGRELTGETQASLGFTAAPARVGTYRARVTAPSGAFRDSADASIEVVPAGITVTPGEGTTADKWQDLFADDVIPNRVQLHGRPVRMGGVTPVTVGVGARYTDLVGASRSPADPSGCRGGAAGSRWLWFQADRSLMVKLTLESKEVDAELTV